MEWLQYIVAKIIAGLMAVWFALVGAPALPPGHYQGYVEAEFVRVGAPESGTLDHLSVARGDRVRQGEPLFILEHTQETASRDAAAAKLAAAQSDLANLTKGRRPQEIDVIVAQKQQALADLDYSKRELGRLKKLAETQVAAQSRLDQAQAAFDRNKARVDELTAAIATARLAARSDEIRAAQAAVASARADLDEAEWRLSRRSVNAPAGATVDDTLYREGEFVPAGSPVVSLLPPENIKLRFFVRETELGSLRVGERVAFGCDSCAEGLHATVSFIAPQAEFTPPVIYSEQTRAKLVYMVEARPENAAALHPGQPVDVSLEP
jgi:HlyD family secretion protein